MKKIIKKIKLKKLPRRRKIQIFVASFSVLLVVAIFSIAYALLTNNVTVTGSAVVRKSKWSIQFDNLQSAVTTGTAEELYAPSIVNDVTIADYAVSLVSPGDSVSYTFDVVNDGDYNAIISSVEIDTPSCHGIGDNALTDADNVCENIEYTLKYSNDSTDVEPSNSRILESMSSETMVLTIKYADNIPAAKLPKDDVEITNLSITITYQQTGDAKVNPDGTTPKIPTYEVGDEITVNGIDFYVIEDSDSSKDYVVALKAVPLTVDEVNLYGSSIPVSAQNFSGYGGMAYGSSSDYSISNIKIIVDAWEDDMFKQSELKSVNNHSVRLITKDEYMNLDVYNWRYSNKYWYWTMTANSSTAIWMVYKDGSVQNPQSWVNIGSVRPVINVYKSAITQS